MRISKKCYYALRALFELALRQTAAPVAVAEIASAQDIPARFLETILNELRHAGLVVSHRGNAGGYSLAAPAEKTTVADIVEVMGYGWAAYPDSDGGLNAPDTMHFVMRSATGAVARCSGSFVSPGLPHNRHSQITCTLRGDQGSGCAEYSNLIYSAQFEQPEIHDYTDKHPYYFRFGGEHHHAGEYQNYFEYFARCLREKRVPKPDLIEGIGTIALLQAMDQALQTGAPVQLPDMLAQYDLADVMH